MEQARRAIRWEIILVIAASLGVSTGMETSGASGEHSALLVVSTLHCLWGFITCLLLSCHAHTQ